MSVKIRLSRGGTKKRPFYRIVVADARMPRDGRFVEKIGTFDPLKAKDDASRVVLDQEKAKAWLAKGAQPTDRVLRLLDGLGLAKREAHNNPQKAQPKKKAQERRNPDILKASRKKRIAAGSGVTVEYVNRLLKQHRQMADMMKAMGGGGAKRGMMGKLGQMMGLGGGMPMPSPEQIEAMQKQLGGAGLPGAPSGPPGIPAAPPPGAFNLPAQFPGLGGGPKLPGLGGGFNPFGGKKK